MNDKNIGAVAILLIYCFIVYFVLPISSLMQSMLTVLGLLGLWFFRYLNKKNEKTFQKEHRIKVATSEAR